MLYLVQSNEWFKVGYSASPKERFKAYLSTNPNVIIWGLKEGTLEDEANYHKEFDKYPRKMKEWFQLPKEIVNELKSDFTIPFVVNIAGDPEKNKAKKNQIIEDCKDNPKSFNRSKLHFYCRASKVRYKDWKSPIEVCFWENGKRKTITTGYYWDPKTFHKDLKSKELSAIIKDVEKQYENNFQCKLLLQSQ